MRLAPSRAASPAVAALPSMTPMTCTPSAHNSDAMINATATNRERIARGRIAAGVVMGRRSSIYLHPYRYRGDEKGESDDVGEDDRPAPPDVSIGIVQHRT